MRIECKGCGKVLKAPDSAAGRQVKCPHCKTPLRIPSPKPEPEPAADHFEDFGAASDDDGFGSEFDDIGSEFDDDDDDGGGNRKPCPMCGESIAVKARECRFCGEVLSRNGQKEKRRSRPMGSYGQDDDLTTSDIALGLVCANLGCLLGLIYLIQGKPKALKMIGVATLGQLAWFIIGFALGALDQ